MTFIALKINLHHPSSRSQDRRQIGRECQNLLVSQRPSQYLANIRLWQLIPELDLSRHFITGQVVTTKIHNIIFRDRRIASDNK